jgi:hypothetical protein
MTGTMSKGSTGCIMVNPLTVVPPKEQGKLIYQGRILEKERRTLHVHLVKLVVHFKLNDGAYNAHRCRFLSIF